MLDLRPNCEYCNKDLPPDATDAMICSYECTFCADCVETQLENVCPNCGGGFEKRPIRPRAGLAKDPASTERVKLKRSPLEIEERTHKFRHVAPKDR